MDQSSRGLPHSKRIADAICIITIGMLSSSPLGSTALGAGHRQEGGSFGKRLMLVVGNRSSSRRFLRNSLFGITTLLFLDSHCLNF
jgi:hypothetical protein